MFLAGPKTVPNTYYILHTYYISVMNKLIGNDAQYE